MILIQKNYFYQQHNYQKTVDFENKASVRKNLSIIIIYQNLKINKNTLQAQKNNIKKMMQINNI